MMMMISLLLFLLLAGCVHAGGGIYEIRTTTMRRLDDTVSSSPELVSFDGDLDRIQELALNRANNISSNSAPTKAPILSETTTTYAPTETEEYEPVTCDGVVEHLEIVTWKYSMETVPEAKIPTVYGEVQEKTLEGAVPHSLWCQDNAAAFGNIVTMDANVLSEQMDETCKPVMDDSYSCTVVRGRLRLFLSDSSSADDAISIVLQNIEKLYSDPGFPMRVNTGLMKIEYLYENDSTSTENPVIADDKETTGQLGSTAEGATSIPSFILVAVGSAALVVFVGSIYYWRRRSHHHHGNHHNGDDEEGAATQMAGVSISFANESSSADASSGAQPSSPFSEMVPDAYRLGDNVSILSTTQGMSPVYENDDSTTSGSIVVSESGYTTEAGDSTSTQSGGVGVAAIATKSVYSTNSDKTSEFLGARPRSGPMIRDIEMEEASNTDESDLDTTGELSPGKHFVNNLLVPPGDEPDESGLADDSALLFEAENFVTPKATNISDEDDITSSPNFIKSPESDIKTVNDERTTQAQQQEEESGGDDFEDVNLDEGKPKLDP